MAESSDNIEEKLSNLQIDTLVEDFLIINDVKEKWQRLILDNNDIKAALKESIEMLNKLDENAYLPSKGIILRALSYVDPDDVKVIILGHDPIPDASLATGLAFSAPKDTKIIKSSWKHYKGKTFVILNEVLESAGVNIKEDNYCHENWATNGVLLLNAVLTVAQPGEDWKKHRRIWLKFTQKLIKKFHDDYKKKDVIFIIGWGDNPRELIKKLKLTSYEKEHSCRIYSGHHPTFPKDGNKYRIEAKEQIKSVIKVYPNIFDDVEDT